MIRTCFDPSKAIQIFKADQEISSGAQLVDVEEQVVVVDDQGNERIYNPNKETDVAKYLEDADKYGAKDIYLHPTSICLEK